MPGAYPLGSSPRYFPRIARIYIILLWKWLKGGSFTCTAVYTQLYFPLFFRLLNLRGERPPPSPPPPGYATQAETDLYRVAPKKTDSQCGPSFTKFTDMMR